MTVSGEVELSELLLAAKSDVLGDNTNLYTSW